MEYLLLCGINLSVEFIDTGSTVVRVFSFPVFAILKNARCCETLGTIFLLGPFDA